MITHFDSSFAGHIDMDNVGYRGTPVNDRRFSNEERTITAISGDTVVVGATLLILTSLAHQSVRSHREAHHLETTLWKP